MSLFFLTRALAMVRVFMASMMIVALTPANTPTRWRIAEAISWATWDPEEQDILTMIAARESQFDEAVSDCKVMGKAGDRTAWQIVPRSFAESLALCVSYTQDAMIAIDRVRESLRACRHLPRRERLAVYARGRCDSEEGKKLSRARWPSPPAFPLALAKEM